MFGSGFPELIVILLVALVIFGAGKLPEIWSSLGEGLRDFRRAFEDHGEAKGAPRLECSLCAIDARTGDVARINGRIERTP